MIVSGVTTLYRFLKMAAIESEIYFRVWFSDGTPNFDKISQSTAKIKLLPVSETDGVNAILKFYFRF